MKFNPIAKNCISRKLLLMQRKGSKSTENGHESSL